MARIGLKGTLFIEIKFTAATEWHSIDMRMALRRAVLTLMMFVSGVNGFSDCACRFIASGFNGEEHTIFERRNINCMFSMLFVIFSKRRSGPF